MVDNFDLIRSLLKFKSNDEFYFVQLLQRKKDNKSFGANNRLVKYYCVRSIEHYDRLVPEIKAISKATCSRVYIDLNRRSFKVITLQMLKLLAEYVATNNSQGILNAFASCAGSYRTESEPTWILDIDPDEDGKLMSMRMMNEMVRFIEVHCEPEGPKFVTTIPTLSGYHIIMKPFNLERFHKEFPKVTVHKNNPTLLYFNG